MSRLALLVLCCGVVTILVLGPMVCEALGLEHRLHWAALVVSASIYILVWTGIFCTAETWP